MKRLSVFLFALFCFMTMAQVHAQRIIPVNYYFVYTQAKFDDVSAANYFRRNYKDGGAAFKKRIANTVVRSANKNSMNHKGFSLTNATKARYEVAIYLLDVDDDGANKLEAKVYNKKTKRLMGTVSARAKGGRSNTMERLLIERLQDSGESLGDKLVDKVLKDLYD
jgi:hypothetical protein